MIMDSQSLNKKGKGGKGGMAADIAALRQLNQRLSILYEIALTAGKSLELKEILDDSLHKIIRFMGADSGVIYVIDEETLELVPVSFENVSDAAVIDLCENKVKVGGCVCGTIAEGDHEVVIYENASQDPRFTRDVIKAEGMEFYAGLPLKAKGRVIGVLCIITHVPYTPDDELLDILRAATVPLSLAIDNATIFHNTLRKAHLKIKHHDFQEIIATSAEMQKVLDLVRKITDLPTSILIYGQSGTGKELIARAIHFNSPREDKPFVAVNCAAIPETLLESEFFGYVKGAFTGAADNKMGLFEAANGGSIFLDEVEAMSKSLQAKLLRVLQDRTFFRVGSTEPVTVDVRVIAATNSDLKSSVAANRFREDLYYRLNVIRIDLPPLRDRPEDIPLLLRRFMYRFSQKLGKKVTSISTSAMDALLNHPWPGNVRELENAIERAVAVTDTKELKKEDLPLELAAYKDSPPEGLTLRWVEKEHIKKVLTITQGNRKKAAEILGINSSTLWRKLK